MEDMKRFFRREFLPDKIVRLNTKYIRTAIQYIYWNIYDEKLPLSDFKINEKKSLLFIKNKPVLLWDRHHHYTKESEFIYAISLYLQSVEDTLKNNFEKNE